MQLEAKMGEKLLFKKDDGGSGTGIHYYQMVVECPRKAQLWKQQRETLRRYDSNESADAGTLFHLYTEQYHKGNQLEIEVDDLQLEPALEAANHMFQGYTASHPRDFFGEVLATEILLPPKDMDVVKAQELIEQAVGIYPFTARIDLVCKLDAVHAARLAKIPGLGDVTEGIYIVDHKTTGQKCSSPEYTYGLFSDQLIAYQMLWNTFFPEQRCQGAIANIVINHKTMTDNSFQMALCKTPSEKQEEGIQAWLQYAKYLEDKDICGRSNCLGKFNKPCAAFLGGLCDRSAT